MDTPFDTHITDELLSTTARCASGSTSTRLSTPP